MTKKAENCLVCGKPLSYHTEAAMMECVLCHRSFPSNAACEDGHFVCDQCHASPAVLRIRIMCRELRSSDPYEIAVSLMRDPKVHMHGPENHVLVGAALLTAYRNAGGKLALDEAIEEMARRGEQVPGGVCGLWGCCGAAVSAGIFVSIVTGATPLSKESWGLANRSTAAVLEDIGRVGGPRCCKRNAFLAIARAAEICEKELGVKMELPPQHVCEFSPGNRECLKEDCPFHPSRSKRERKSLL